MNISVLFELATNDILCNTSYPLRPDYFSKYKTDMDIMDGADKLSFYFHIPFCKHLCKFCEYTRFLSGDNKTELMYVQKLEDQVSRYLSLHPVTMLYGLDVGGGTPTVLHMEAFKQLLDLTCNIRNSLTLKNSFESSIEFSFSAIDQQKIEYIAKSGFQRLSAGIQVYDKSLLEQHNRTSNSISEMKKIVSEIHKNDIKKVNLDIMYGFQKQTKEILYNTLNAIEILHPEQVTLYEMRYNINKLKHESINRELLFDQYCYIYERLKKMGYNGRFGQNAFSIYDDEGVSSYLYSRMLGGIPYKGFGVSAQSMSRKGISYNILKMESSTYMPDFKEIIEEDVYLLPKEEIAAKYVCIGLYSGQFSLKVLYDILNRDAMDFYSKEFDFLFEHKLVEIDNNICRLTPDGFRVYGAVAALFWSDYHKERYYKSRGL